MKNRIVLLMTFAMITSAALGQTPPLVSIYDIQYLPPGQPNSPYLGDTVRTGGVVTVGTDVFYAGSGVSFWIGGPAGGPWSGIMSLCPEFQGVPELAVGDSVLFIGIVTESSYQTTLIVIPETVELRMFGLPEPPPAEIPASYLDLSGIGDSLAIQYEGVFCRIYDLTVDTVINYSSTSIWECHDSTGVCLVREASDSIPNSYRPDEGTEFEFIQGVVGARFGAFHLQPRYLRDLRLDQLSVEDYLPKPIYIELLQNYPNPFNASTTIEFTLPEESEVELVVYDLLGRKVATLIEGTKPAGIHSIIWDAEDVQSGVYFARLESKDKVRNMKMVLLK